MIKETMMATKNDAGYVIRLSENALIGVILNGIEAYSVKHNKKFKYVETYGSLFGYQSKMKDMRTLYQIEMINTDTSAIRTSSEVAFKLEALKLKIETMNRYWPHLEYLGDFHTHPYENHASVKKTALEVGTRKGENKGYFFSQGDKESLESLKVFYKKNMANYRVGLVVTIAAIAADRGKEAEKIHNNCIGFNLKRHKMWITAYSAFEKNGELFYTDNIDNKVYLECQSVLGNITSFI